MQCNLSYLKTHPKIKNRLRVIWKSEAFGPPPILVPTDLPNETKEELQAVFLSMSRDAQGRKILDGLDIDRLREIRAGEYDSAYKVWKTIDWQK